MIKNTQNIFFKTLFFLLLFFIALIQFVFCENMTQEDLYKFLSENGKNINTIRFGFKQETINIDKKSDSNLISGNILYKSPNKFRVVYKKPEIIYLYNGNKLVIYDKIKNQVLRNNKNISEPSNPENFFGKEIIDFFKFDDALNNKYRISSYWIEDKFYCLIFTDKDTNYKVTLYIDKKQFYPKKIIWDKDYIKFIITINDISFTSKIYDSDFEFEIKENMKVFDV